MMNRYVVMAAAWLEIIVGATFLTVPDIPCRLLFAATPDGVGLPLARFAGIALAALGIACHPAKATGSNRIAVLGLFVFNAGAAIFCAWMAIATSFRGLLLWPVVILHAVIAIALLS